LGRTLIRPTPTDSCFEPDAMTPRKTPRFAQFLALAAVAVPMASDALAADQPALSPIRGIIRAVDQAELSTDLVARVAKVGFREGEAFKEGELLMSFECERYQAEAQSADAVYREMKVTLDGNNALNKYQAIGKSDLEISKARVSKAEAEARALKARVKQCEIKAPFAGRVSTLSINAFEQPQPGKPFMTIVGGGRLEIELIAPSTWLTWMKPGQTFDFAVDETQNSYAASVVRLAPAVDAISQMVKIIAVFQAPATDILPGMSGEARFVAPNG
jgi:membrane fusion protein, multidrug efflux system